MIKSKKGFSITILVSILVVYLVSPYLSAWKMIQAVTEGNVLEVQQYVDFNSVKESAKNQIEKSLQDQINEQPMAAMFAPMMKAMTDQILDELIDPEKLSKVIKHGKLSQSSKSSRPEIEDTEITSWYAFFVRPDRFLIQLDDLALYMELQGLGWKVTALGVEDLMNGGAVDNKGSEVTAEEDVLDENPPIKPEILSEVKLNEIIKELSGRFYLDWDQGDTVTARGNINYLSVKDSISPIVKWGMATDEDGNSNLGTFSTEKRLKREEYQSANRYYRGMWSDEIPKKNSDKKIKSAAGILEFSVPIDIASFVVESDDVGIENEASSIRFKLNSLKNGHISFEWYQSYELEALTPIVIIRNSEGDALATSSSSSSSPLKPVEESRFSQPMRFVNKSLSVKGTPSNVEVYFVISEKRIELPITAYSKPELVLKKLSEPIRQTVLVEPYVEPDFERLSKKEVESLIAIQYEENENWQGKKRRSIKLSLPKNANTIFSKSDVSSLKLMKDGESVLFRPTSWRQSENHTYHFVEPSTNNSSEVDVSFDNINGSILLKYPKTLDLFRIYQGEAKHGVSLKDAAITFHAIYDDPDLTRNDKVFNPTIPNYTSVFSSKSVLAYDSKGREISYLAENHSWGGEDKEIFFWGIPEYIEVKRITSWHEIELPVSLSESDLVVIKKTM